MEEPSLTLGSVAVRTAPRRNLPHTKHPFRHQSPPISSNLRLNQTLHARLKRPNPHQPKPHPLQQILPVLLRALSRGENGHEQQIQARTHSRRAFVGDHDLVDQKLAVVFCEGGFELGEDLFAFGIGPIGQDRVEVACSCS